MIGNCDVMSVAEIAVMVKERDAKGRECPSAKRYDAILAAEMLRAVSRKTHSILC